MESTIKNAIRGSALYFYYLSHPENEFLELEINKPLLNTSDKCYEFGGPIYKVIYFALYSCYTCIVKSRLSIIYDIVSNVTNDELEILARIAIEEYNKDLIELLHKQGIDYDFYIPEPEDIRHILDCGYINHGLDIIKFLGELDINIRLEAGFAKHAVDNNDKEFLEYLIENGKSLDDIFESVLHECDVKTVLDLFMDKIDMSKRDNLILELVCIKAPHMFMSLPEYGISIDSNTTLLNYACENKNTDIIEFCLQNGMPVDKDILRQLLFFGYSRNNTARSKKNNKEMLNLFLRYNVDFSILEFEPVDYELLANLENSGLNKDALLLTLINL